MNENLLSSYVYLYRFLTRVLTPFLCKKMSKSKEKKYLTHNIVHYSESEKPSIPVLLTFTKKSQKSKKIYMKIHIAF